MTKVVIAASSSIPPAPQGSSADAPPASPHRSGTHFTTPARPPLESSSRETAAFDSSPRASSPPDGEPRRSRSWGDLYRDHADFVWRCLRRMGLANEDAADALHEVFLIVHRRESAFDPTRGTERGWLFGISANVVRAERRRRRPELHADGQESPRACVAPTGDIVGESSWRAADGAGANAGELLKQALHRAIDDLSPEHRAVFTMFEIEGADCRVIAEELDVPVGTVYSRLHKARETLRLALADFRRAPTRGGRP